MNIKIKDKIFELKDNFIDNEYFLDLAKAENIGNECYEIKSSIKNFKLLHKYTCEQDKLKKYFNELIKLKRSNDNDLFKNYSFLYDFQKEGAIKIFNSNYSGYLLSFEQGLGKTLTSLVTASLRKDIKNVWCIVPASLLEQWKEEINNWLKEECIIFKGTKKHREKLYKNCLGNKWNIISYETFMRDYKVNDNLKSSFDYSLVIFDEATKLKNKKTNLYKLFKQILPRTKFKLFLTGTPVSNGLLDINNIIKLINPRLTGALSNYVIYENKVVGWGNNAKVYPELVGYKNLDLYVERINPIYYRKTKEQVAPQLPKKNIITLNIEQTKLHQKIEKEIYQMLSPFEGFTLLQLLECGVEVFKNSNSENAQVLKEVIKGKIINPKINILKDLLYEINNQVLIFSRFKTSCDNIAIELEKEFKDKKIAVVSSNTRNKNDIATKFKSKVIDIVVCTDTWARGVSFPDIDYEINFDVIPSYEVYFQRQDRIHRINSTTPKFVYNLVGDIIEKHIMEILSSKLGIAEQITEGKAININDSDLRNQVIKKLGWN